MGREARRKQQALREGRTTLRGNPAPDPPLMMKTIDLEKVTNAVRANGIARVRFSDRTYAMGKDGVLRRERPAIVEITKTTAASATP